MIGGGFGGVGWKLDGLDWVEEGVRGVICLIFLSSCVVKGRCIGERRGGVFFFEILGLFER